MCKLLIIAWLVGKLTITSYRSIPQQTDDSPLYTSTNQHVYKGGCAISRDLLCKACRRLHHRCKRPDDRRYIHYGDYLYVQGHGIVQVNDVMGAVEHYTVRTKGGKKIRFHTIRNQIDIWCASYAEEKRYGVSKVFVWRLEINEKM